MLKPVSFFAPEKTGHLRAALFLSGQGSNAEVLLKINAGTPSPGYRIELLVTDAPESSRARELAREYRIPLVEHDLKKFYLRNGENSTSLKTPRGRELRTLWTEELRKKLAPFEIDFGILAGFMTLCNIAEDFPCLNVHPGDLTKLDAGGRRILAGLHVRPVERALCDNTMDSLRSSVIVIRPFSGDGAGEVDSGFLLGISEAVPMDRGIYSAEELSQIRAERKPGTPVSDDLRSLALRNIETLKVRGDHRVFPEAVRLFAAGRYAFSGNDLYFRDESGKFVPVRTAELAPGKAPKLLL